jgi:protein SCO1/2
MKRFFAVALLACLAAPAVTAADRHAARGMVVSVSRPNHRFTASIEDIPGIMKAMTMPFEVRRDAELDALSPGALIEFTLVVDGNTSYVEAIKVVRQPSVEQDPFAANRLATLNEIVAGIPAVPALAIGDTVPDFTLIDQTNRRVTLASLRGKVVALNFVYTSCALPNFCLRIANHFNVLQKRFQNRLGRDLVLLTVTFDPAHDTPEVLATYAAQWNADPAVWHFLTGPPADIQRVCRMFGVHAFPNEGLMDHSLHTVIINRRGTLAVNIEGNSYSAVQLGDLTAELLK